MKYLDEYRAGDRIRRVAREIEALVTRPWTLMEVCGGQTQSIVRYGIDLLLPECVTLIHGPGCPVCVTPAEDIDAALALARRPSVILCSFGDMLRVPGSETDLLSVKAEGGDVRVVYSPLDAVVIAEQNPDRDVVFFAVGFETTAPASAAAIERAERLGLERFSALVSHVRVPPALTSILEAPDNRVQGILAAGHVCTIMGTEEYERLVERHRVPIVVTGFEPLDLMWGIRSCLSQLEVGRAEVENRYARTVRSSGNPAARACMERVFEIVAWPWRGLGRMPAGGLALRPAYHRFDARRRFEWVTPRPRPATECRSGEVLRGVLKPPDCPAFGEACTPDHPLGAPMVSSEGACAAYFRYRGAELGDVHE
ncbi:MAG: hydrogenase formation protein HypD [Planctomycetota bacterium]